MNFGSGLAVASQYKVNLWKPKSILKVENRQKVKEKIVKTSVNTHVGYGIVVQIRHGIRTKFRVSITFRSSWVKR